MHVLVKYQFRKKYLTPDAHLSAVFKTKALLRDNNL